MSSAHEVLVLSPDNTMERLLPFESNTYPVRTSKCLKNRKVASSSWEMADRRYGGTDRGGWEVAAGEFYQEDFSGGASKTREDLTRDMDDRVLPSHFATVGRKLGKTTSTYYQKHGTAYTAAGTNEILLPDLSDATHDEIRSWEEIQEIRNLPISIAEKLDLKNKLLHTPTFRVRGVAAIRLKQKKWRHSLGKRLKNVFSNFVPWNGQIKSIEGKYGSAHVAFFMFIRWLFFLNLAMSMIVGLFIVLPSELSHLSDECERTLSSFKVKFPDDNKSFSEMSYTELPIRNDSEIASSVVYHYSSSQALSQCPGEVSIAVCGQNLNGTSILATKSCWEAYKNNVKVSDNAVSAVQDFIQGTGWMELTLAFYGYYNPLIFSWEDYTFYNLPLAYLLVMVSLAILCFGSICDTIRRGLYLKAYSNSRQYRYTELVFSTWNYFVADSKTKKLKIRIMIQAFKDALLKDKIRQARISQTTKQRINLVFVRLFVWMIVAGLLCACGYAIYVAVVFSQSWVKNKTKTSNDITFLVVSYLPSIVITALNFILPFILERLIVLEKYQAENEITVQLFRRIIVRVTSLVILVITIFSADYSNSDGCCDETTTNKTNCWETKLGQEIYKLALFDFATILVMTFIVHFIWSRLALSQAANKKCVIFKPRIFSVVDNSLDLIYNQCLCWIGIYFSPAVVFVITIISFLAFYINLFKCKVNCVQSQRFVSVVKSSSLFLNVLLVVNMASMCVVGYAVIYVPTSSACGPFRGIGYAWQAVVLEIVKLPSSTQDFLFFLGMPNFYIILLVISSLAIIYLLAVISSQKLVISSLRNQLNWVSKDKQFLLSRIESKMNRSFQDDISPRNYREERGYTTH